MVSVALVASLAGCSDTTGQARDLAREACTAPAPSAPNFDPDEADPGLLRGLASSARTRADVSARAAELDERWAVLSEAANLLSAAAERILEVRLDGGVVAEELPPEVWDQIKYASDAFGVECRGAVD